MKPEALRIIAFLMLASLMLAATLHAQDDEDDGFTPRSGTPPAQRTGGASRTESDAPSVILLAPADTAGLTTREQPVVYWYLSKNTDANIVAAITDPRTLENPVLETTLKGPHKAGLHKLDLSKPAPGNKPVKFDPSVKYELVVTVEVNDASGSENPSATCVVMRLDPKETPPIPDVDPAKVAPVYGKKGIWFDYLYALNLAIEANPRDEALLQKRAKALAAQGLTWKPDGSITERASKDGAAAKP